MLFSCSENVQYNLFRIIFEKSYKPIIPGLYKIHNCGIFLIQFLGIVN